MATQNDSTRSDPMARSIRHLARVPALVKALCVLQAGWTLIFAAQPRAVGAEYFYVDYSRIVSPVNLRLYDLSILSPEADVDLTAGHKMGHRFRAENR